MAIKNMITSSVNFGINLVFGEICHTQIRIIPNPCPRTQMQPEIKGLPAALEFQSHLSSGIIQEQYAILEDQSQSFDLSRAGSNALLRDRESSEPVPAYAPNPPMELTTVTTNVPPPVYTPPTPYGMVHTHQSPAPNSDRTETATAATMVVYLPPEHRDPRCLKQALSDDSTLWSLEETDSTAGGALSSPSDPDVLQQFGGAVATGNQPTGLANSNSSGYQSLGRQSVSDRCRPPVATVEERRRPRRPLSSLNGDTPPVQSPSSGSCTPNEAVVEPIQAFPSAPTSRHTYVNLSDEALARIAVPPPASNSHRTPPDTAVAGLPHSWNETADGDDCCNAFTPPPPAESPSPRSSRCVPRLDSMGFVAGGVGGRQQHRPRLDGIHSVRSKLPSSHTEASRRPRLFRDDLSPPPTDGYTLQTEIDASQARLAEARSRLLANEAERIQLIRVWHEELMKQSQLVNTASVELWGATAEETEPPPPPPQRGRNHGGSLSAARGAVTRSPSSPGLSNTAAGANNDQHQ